MSNDRLSKLKQVILRCKKDPIYFLDNFCKVKHPKAGIIPFKLFTYQKSAVKDFMKYRFNMFRKTRQSGISTVAGGFALWYGMFYSHKTILIVSKRDDDAMVFLDRNVKFVYDNLPSEFRALWGDPPKTYNEHEIEFPNGSIIRSLTSGKETLRSNSSSLNIIDESAFMPHMEEMWAGGYSTLMHGGSVIVISTCVTADSIVRTNRGLEAIGDCANDFVKYDDNYDVADVDVKVYTDNGSHKATKLYRHNKSQCIRLKTRSWNNLSCEVNHALRIFNDGGLVWSHARDVKIGDYVPIVAGKADWTGNDILDYKVEATRYNHNQFYIEKIDVELAYLMGIILAEGYQNKNYTVVANGDKEILDRFLLYKPIKWIKEHKRHDTHVRCLSKHFADFLVWFGLKQIKAPYKEIPKRLLTCSPHIIRSFIKGMFDGDGFSRKRNGEIGYVSTSLRLIEMLKQLLLSFGIHSRIDPRKGCVKEFHNERTTYISKCRPSYVLTINGKSAAKFYEEISFGLKRKQDNYKNLVDSDILTPPIAHIVRRWMRTHALSIAKLSEVVSISKILFHGTGRISVKTLNKILEAFPNNKCQDFELLKFIARQDIRFEEVVEKENIGKQVTYDFTVPQKGDFLTNGFISHNTNGCGNWYHATWEDAVNGNNQFHPIVVNWWDMDWTVEYTDEITGKKTSIRPCDGLKKTETKDEIEKYGQYWSPWLEEQYRQLQQKGEAHKFRQEILAEFIGSGDTVVSRKALLHVSTTVNDNYKVVEQVPYVHPVSNEQVIIDFERRLWVWHKPVRSEPDVIENGRIIKPGKPGHSYVMGVDIASGEADDFSAIEVIDCNTQQQVAELYIKVEPSVLLMMMDYIGRWYNTAYIVPERTGLGIPVCQSLYNEIAYVNVFRMKNPSGKASKKVGFPTTPVYKPQINKMLLDNICQDGVEIYSNRLLQQLQIYINKGGGQTGHADGPGNHSDLPIAFGLALLGVSEAVQSDQSALVPTRHQTDDIAEPVMVKGDVNNILVQGGLSALMPFLPSQSVGGMLNPEEELAMFARQLGGIPIGSKESIQAFHKPRNIVLYNNPHRSI